MWGRPLSIATGIGGRDAERSCKIGTVTVNRPGLLASSVATSMGDSGTVGRVNWTPWAAGAVVGGKAIGAVA